MTKEVKAYTAEVETFLKDAHGGAELSEFSADMLTRIGFYQHERLVHLIVTMSVALMMILAFIKASSDISFVLLAGVLMCLTIPYISHYYFLENSVQKLYKLYYRLQEQIKKSSERP
ncbi:hypothetical protein FACS1894188_12050 [Clostridia bacterium]|nr:hypothetical protein FACS1894188_12050 [Clostridia bacterium]